ncbi:MAG TPA: ankyrin repeat domain-containing protein, partial [Polyangia bacterium]|nr:ankyrin repeat domain-containing protein [Polyangia bacterium]
HQPDGQVEISGYPEALFPPTDFHTATLVDDAIYVIGSLGYHGTRRPGETQVFRLDLESLPMERVETDGEGPGWIYGHRAELIERDLIRVWGGTVITSREGKEAHAPNPGRFVLDLSRRRWRREAAGH